MDQLLQVIQQPLGLPHAAAACKSRPCGPCSTAAIRCRPAHRRRQVALLPGPGRAPRRHHRRRLAAHRPDEGPGGQPPGLRRRRPSSSTARCRPSRTLRLRDGPAARATSACCSSRRNGWCMTDFCRLLQRLDVQTFAIDEAHCISHWGHDFRPEYRQLGRLARAVPQAVGPRLHGHRHRAGPARHLRAARPAGPGRPGRQLRSAEPDLSRAAAARRLQAGAGGARPARRRGRHHLLPRAAATSTSWPPTLKSQGVKAPALPRRHGRRSNASGRQEAFATEKCDLIVATVAFGMGIDRSNIRFVLHTAMPKSIEHYQQETGRAGRDGLEAECVLLYSGGDFMPSEADRWRSRPRRPSVEARFPGRTRSSTSTTWTATAAAPSAGIGPWCEYFGQSLRAGHLRRLRPVPGRHRGGARRPWSSPRRSCPAWPASRSASASTTSSACCAARTPRTSASAATTS